MLWLLSRAGQGDNAKAAAPPRIIFTCNEPITSWQLPQCPVLGTLRQTDRYIIQLHCQLPGKPHGGNVSGLEGCTGRELTAFSLAVSLSWTHGRRPIYNFLNNVSPCLCCLTALCDEELQLASDARTEKKHIRSHVSGSHHSMRLV